MMKNRKKPMAAVLAVCAVLALSVTAFASGGVAGVIQMLSVPNVQLSLNPELDRDGAYAFTASSGGEETVSPVELREDGRLYLTVNGENRDITDECSHETPYIYTCTGEDGLPHTFIIGGEPESIGWVEYAGDEEYADGGNEKIALSGMVFEIPDDTPLENLPWLDAGLQQAMGVRLDNLPFTVSEIDPYEAVSEDGGMIKQVIISAGEEPDGDIYDADGNVIGTSSQVTSVTVTVNPE